MLSALKEYLWNTVHPHRPPWRRCRIQIAERRRFERWGGKHSWSL